MGGGLTSGLRMQGLPVLCFAAHGSEPPLACFTLVGFAAGWWNGGFRVEECVHLFLVHHLLLGFVSLLECFPVCWCRWAGCLVDGLLLVPSAGASTSCRTANLETTDSVSPWLALVGFLRCRSGTNAMHRAAVNVDLYVGIAFCCFSTSHGWWTSFVGGRAVLRVALLAWFP
jgi:hypothetical protein